VRTGDWSLAQQLVDIVVGLLVGAWNVVALLDKLSWLHFDFEA